MNKVLLRKNGKKGILEWSDTMKTINVDFPDKDITDRINTFLRTSKVYKIPQSDILDDYKEQTARPIDSSDFMFLGLCTLKEQTGISIDFN